MTSIWCPPWLAGVGNHLWQSTAFAVVAWLLTVSLRRNSARVRHGVWMAASVKFLVPLSLLIAMGGQIARWTTAPVVSRSRLVVVMDEISQPLAVSVASASVRAAAAGRNLLPEVLMIAWAIGFVGIACAWLVRWLRLRDVIRAGLSVDMDIPVRVRMSGTSLEPGVFGIFRPVLMLPEGIFERLTPRQMEAVIAHELCHVRNRDNLSAAIQMFVETVFWFHPLVWWIGKRMVTERERACDEEVLRGGGERRVYADAILSVCRLYVESPLVCVSGITGSDLKKRIEAIMIGLRGERMSFAKRLVVASVAFLAVAGPVAVGVVIGIVNVPRLLGQTPGVPVVTPGLVQTEPADAALIQAEQMQKRLELQALAEKLRHEEREGQDAATGSSTLQEQRATLEAALQELEKAKAQLSQVQSDGTAGAAQNTGWTADQTQLQKLREALQALAAARSQMAPKSFVVDGVTHMEAPAIGAFVGGRFHHTLTGTEFTPPLGWTIQREGQSSGGGEQVGFRGDASIPPVEAIVWMKAETYDGGSLHDRLYESMNFKAGQRSGDATYTMLRKTAIEKSVGGHPALSVQATYIENGVNMIEYHTWVWSEKTHAYIAARMRAEDFPVIQERIDQMLGTFSIQ